MVQRFAVAPTRVAEQGDVIEPLPNLNIGEDDPEDGKLEYAAAQVRGIHARCQPE
jgi:hypothetical protein